VGSGRQQRRRTWALVTVALVVALSVPLAVPVGAESLGHQRFYWSWSDGANATTRTFDQDSYLVQAHLPTLVVRARPITPARRVVLQYRDGAAWRDEDIATTDADGAAILELNPYDVGGAWTTHACAYRLLVDGRTATLTVQYER
jgi:hypothetical protein